MWATTAIRIVNGFQYWYRDGVLIKTTSISSDFLSSQVRVDPGFTCRLGKSMPNWDDGETLG